MLIKLKHSLPRSPFCVGHALPPHQRLLTFEPIAVPGFDQSEIGFHILETVRAIFANQSECVLHIQAVASAGKQICRC